MNYNLFAAVDKQSVCIRRCCWDARCRFITTPSLDCRGLLLWATSSSRLRRLLLAAVLPLLQHLDVHRLRRSMLRLLLSLLLLLLPLLCL